MGDDPRRNRTFGATVLLAVGASLISCTREAPRPAGIVLITLDTTRADHLGCYGNGAALTPNLDAFATQAVRFEQAMAAVPTTLASHSTMFTGQYPPVHGVRYNGMFRLGDASVTIAERFHDAGFATAAVPASFPVNAKSGLRQGFDIYRDLFSEAGAASIKPESERPASDVTRLGLEAIRAAGPRPFFVWLHYFDAHFPYQPPFPYSSKFHDHPYDGEIASVDAQLGTLFAELKSLGLWDRTAIVIAGDHGEGLYEHGERMHAQLTYQSTLHVPLMIKGAGVSRGRVVAEPVTLADVAPTLLELGGLKLPAELDGVSLVPTLAGRQPPRRALYFETLAGSLNFGWSPLEGVRRGKWKLIRSSDPELYDLEADPSEKVNLYQRESDVAADLSAALDSDLARWAKSAAPAEATAVPLDPAAVTRLASLGYVGGSVSPAYRGGPSPRSKVNLEGELLLLQDMMVQGLPKNALIAAANVLREDPGNRLALNSAAEASVQLRDFDAAKRYGRDLLARYPDFVPGWLTQGRIEVAKKDYRAAESVFRSGLTHVPDEPSLTYSLALSLLAEKRTRDAKPIIEKAVGVSRADPSFRVLLALCDAMEGDAASARTELTRAIRDGYAGIETLREEPLLAPLRKIPGFEEAVAPKKGA